jgi:hypothetical protein
MEPGMKLHFHLTTPEAAPWRARALARVRDALRHLRASMAEVAIRLMPDDDARAGQRARCEIEARLPGGSEVHVHATARGWIEAVAAAARRLRDEIAASLRAAQAGEPLGLQPAPVPVRATTPARLPARRQRR